MGAAGLRQARPELLLSQLLADAIDRNGDGVIQSRERIYAAGTYPTAGC